ncbi:MAG TPA: DegT/DnrJ/EryC1/StrS family aminotransferase [Pyrinomonadaceae bacterium]|nr:DegT/DnrJ/EryC1/StrS family aminotransferase [Pyrinomonadaceae bacterium]
MAQTKPSMNVPLIDLRAQYASIRESVREAVDRVFESQHFVMGPEVAALEAEVAAYCQTREAIGCASGSDALLLALMALNVGPETEVITTPFSFFATASAIARLGARPVFVDIDPLTYNLNVDLVEAAITERTRVVLPVHLYGQCADMDQIMALCKAKNLIVIEDAAQAIGAEDRGRRAGSMGLAGSFSFYPSKNLGAAGDAGIITTSDSDFALRVRRLRVHGGLTEYQHVEVGINSRIDAVQAAVLRAKLPYLDQWSNARAQKAEKYSELLEAAKLHFRLTPPFVKNDSRHIFHQYVIRVPEYRDALMEHLKARGVATKVYYPIPLHLQECFAYLGYKAGEFPKAEAAARETFALPLYPELTDEQQEYVVNAIQDFKP